MSIFDNYKGKAKAQVQKYIELMYDSRSPLVKQHQVIKDRRAAALTEAGFQFKDNGKWEIKDLLSETEVDDIINLDNDRVLDLVLQYRKKVNPSRLWDMIFSNETVFDEYQKILLTPIDKENIKDEKQYVEAANKKNEMMKQCDEIHKRLKAYYIEAYGDDVLADKATQRISSPENMAKRA